MLDLIYKSFVVYDNEKMLSFVQASLLYDQSLLIDIGIDSFSVTRLWCNQHFFLGGFKKKGLINIT